MDLPCGRIPDSQFRSEVRIDETTVVQRPDAWTAQI